MVSRPEDAIVLPPFIEDAYAQAKVFCRLLSKRANTRFFRTMLLRRMGGTMEAGRLTVARILDGWGDPGQSLFQYEDEPEGGEGEGAVVGVGK